MQRVELCDIVERVKRIPQIGGARLRRIQSDRERQNSTVFASEIDIFFYGREKGGPHGHLRKPSPQNGSTLPADIVRQANARLDRFVIRVKPLVYDWAVTNTKLRAVRINAPIEDSIVHFLRYGVVVVAQA